VEKLSAKNPAALKFEAEISIVLMTMEFNFQLRLDLPVQRGAPDLNIMGKGQTCCMGFQGF
jgi:hypothetical protein